MVSIVASLDFQHINLLTQGCWQHFLLNYWFYLATGPSCICCSTSVNLCCANLQELEERLQSHYKERVLISPGFLRGECRGILEDIDLNSWREINQLWKPLMLPPAV